MDQKNTRSLRLLFDDGLINSKTKFYETITESLWHIWVTNYQIMYASPPNEWQWPSTLSQMRKKCQQQQKLKDNCWGQFPGWIQTFSRTLKGILFYQRNPFISMNDSDTIYVREIVWSRCVTYSQLFYFKRVKSCWANNHLQKRTNKPATPYFSLYSLSTYNIARSRNC